MAKPKKTKSKNPLAGINIQGISYHIFVRHLALWLTVLFFAFWYISSRFDHVTAMETVKKLTHQLEVVRTDVQSERSEYMSRTCESSMTQMVDSLDMGLSIQEQPPYKFSLK